MYFKNQLIEMETLQEHLLKKIKVLNETTWEYRVHRPKIDKWLDNFDDEKEKLHALYLLSHFMYFGSLQIRELLKSLYRDLFKYPIIEKLRIAKSHNTDFKELEKFFNEAESKTRFLGIGNPSESGTHLLYFFRQENKMSKSLFINTHEIYEIDPNGRLAFIDDSIDHYVFIDDFCGSGTQASSYSEKIVKNIKQINANVKVSYLMLFSTTFGKNEVKKNTLFDYVEAVVELDDSFKCFDSSSRYFEGAPSEIDKLYMQKVCEGYGSTLMTHICEQLGFTKITNPPLSDVVNESRLGWGNSQLLIGFHHNTPDNTLPIVWYDEEVVNWFPIFRRYNKKYGS